MPKTKGTKTLSIDSLREVTSPSCRPSFGSAFLDCTHNPSCGRWVLHIFDSCQIRELCDPKSPTFDHVYKCKSCGAERMWGTSGDYYEKHSSD